MKTFATVLGLFLLSTSVAVAESREQKVEKLIKQLDSSSASERAKAAEEIGKMAEIKVSLGKPAVPKLIHLLEDKDTSVRAAAAGAACRCDEKDVVAPVIKMLKEEKEDRVKVQAIMGLGVMGGTAKDALPTIREIGQKAREDKNNRLALVCRNAAEEIMGRPVGKKN